MKKFTYIIIDLSEFDEPEYVCKTKKEFMNSLFYNRDIAKEYNETNCTKKSLIESFRKNNNFEVRFNDFLYIKEYNKIEGGAE